VKHVIVGHVALDRIVTEEGTSHRLGGPPSYGCAISGALDHEIGVITRIGPDFPVKFVEKYQEWGINLEKWRCESLSTSFTLDYTRKPRWLGLENVCEAIILPEKHYDSVIFSPIAGELTSEQVCNVYAGYVALDPQGFIRERYGKGAVRLVPWEELCEVNLLKTSLEEHRYLTGESDPLRSLRYFSEKGVEASIITMGDEGALVCHNGDVFEVPVYPTMSVDSTGAGDSFLVAAHDKLASGGSICWALAYGSAVASGMVETLGPEFNLSLDEIIRRAEYVQERISKRS
jgi:sugar/nucleoside kinase (ribokinase family)